MSLDGAHAHSDADHSNAEHGIWIHGPHPQNTFSLLRDAPSGYLSVAGLVLERRTRVAANEMTLAIDCRVPRLPQAPFQQLFARVLPEALPYAILGVLSSGPINGRYPCT